MDGVQASLALDTGVGYGRAVERDLCVCVWCVECVCVWSVCGMCVCGVCVWCGVRGTGRISLFSCAW